MATRVLFAQSPEWKLAGGHLDELLHGPDFRIIKRTPRTCAGVARLNGVEVFIKRVTNNSWLKGITARIFGSRAQRSVRGARLLEHAGFAHPKLLAACEQRQFGAIVASYIITEYLRRPKILSRVALADGRDFRWRRRLSGELAGMIRSLHAAGCYTRDLQETNLMVEAPGGALRIYFADMEDFRRFPLIPVRLRLNNLLQLDRSIGRFVSRPHRLRFLYSYLGADAGRAEVRVMIRRLERLRLRVERRKYRRLSSRTIIPHAAGSQRPNTRGSS